MKCLFLAALVLFLIGVRDPVSADWVSKDHPINVTATPHVGLAPMDVYISAFVFPSKDNRVLEVQVKLEGMASDEYVDLSWEQIDEMAPIQHIFEFKHLEGGIYIAQACVTDVKEKHVCRQTRFLSNDPDVER